ncbi:glycosyltransferase family 4 protein [soil metagenome]
MLGWELPPYNSGGLGTACLGLTEGLSAQDVDISFVVPKVFGPLPFNHMKVVSAVDYGDDSLLKTLLERDDIQQELITHQLAYGGRVTIDEQKRLLVEHLSQSLPVSPNTQAVWYAKQAEEIARQDDDFQVVHAHDWMTYYGGIAARAVAKAKGKVVPFVAHVHATEYDRCGEFGDPAIIEIERRGLQEADRVIAVSHYTKEVIHRYYQIPRAKISVVHNGIPAHRKPAKFNIAALKAHHKIVLFMGRITMQKGPEYFVQLAKAVTDQDPSVRFVMVGSGDMEKRCIEEAAATGLTGKMLFSSFLRGTDVDKAYQLADLFVMPSVSEPFGIVALEAMQNGTPTLVSKQSGVSEVSDNVMKVDFWNIEEMTASVLHTLKNPDHHAALKAGGHKDLQHLTWDHAAEKMNQVYQDILGSFAPAQLALQPAIAGTL